MSHDEKDQNPFNLNEIDADTLGEMEIPVPPLEKQQQVVAEIERRIAAGEAEEVVVPDVMNAVMAGRFPPPTH